MHILHIHFLCLVNVYKSEKSETELFVNTTQTSAQTVPIGQFSVQMCKMPSLQNSTKLSNISKCRGASHRLMPDMHLIYQFSEMT